MKTAKSRFRLLSVVLCLIMCLTIPVSVMAADELPALSGVNLSGSVLSWDAFEGAKIYYLTIDNAAPTNITDTSFDLDAKLRSVNKASGTYEVTVAAYSDYSWRGGKQLSATYKCIYTYTSTQKELAAPVNLRWDGKVAKWDAVADAESYTIYLYIDGAASSTKQVYDIKDTSYDVSGCLMEGTHTYVFQVAAEAVDCKRGASDKSAAAEFSTELPALSNVKLEDGVLSWDAFDGATVYCVKFDDAGESNITDTRIDLDARLAELKSDSGTYEVTVAAYSDYSWRGGRQLSATYSGSYTYTSEQGQLDKAVNLKWDGKVASWDAVTDAESYTVLLYVDGAASSNIQVYGIKETSFDISDHLAEGTHTYVFQIAAEAGDHKSSISDKSASTDPISYGLPSIANVKISDGVLSWDALDGAADYVLSTSGLENEIISGTSADIDAALKKAGKPSGKYVILLYARNSKGETISETWSESAYDYKIKHWINVYSINDDKGSTSGSGYFREGDRVFIYAQAAEGYEFDYWTNAWGQVIDGADATYSFILEAGSSTDYAAWFKKLPGMGEWKRNSKGWWYELPDGSYYDNGIFEIDGTYYAFNEKGYMATGWYKNKSEDLWYHFSSSGAMEYGWLKDGGKWYYLDPEDGYMWSEYCNDIDGEFYYFDKSGAMVTGWLKYMYTEMEFDWYHFSPSGAMEYGWIKDGNKWYYLDPVSGYLWRDKEYAEIDGKYYSFDESGAMRTGWYNYNPESSSGWVHFSSSGALDIAKWVGDYYVDDDASMVTYAYIKNGDKYYWVNKDGKYTGTYSEAEKGYYVYDQATGHIIVWPVEVM